VNKIATQDWLFEELSGISKTGSDPKLTLDRFPWKQDKWANVSLDLQ